MVSEQLIRPGRRNRTPRLVIGLMLLALAWLFGNPPFAAPDERDHFVRAVGISAGTVVGTPVPRTVIGGSAQEIRYDRQTQRSVLVPARLDPTPYNCYVRNALLSARCLNQAPKTGPPMSRITTVGTYPPLALLGPAAILGAADDPLDAVYLGRTIAMTIGMLLLIAAVLVLYEPGRWLSLAGLLAACTPTALFLMSSLSPSGLSVSAGLALTASLPRLGREPSAPWGVWLLLGVSGALLALSHPTGVGATMTLVAGLAAVNGVRRSWRTVSERWRAAWLGLSVLALGVAGGVLWTLAYGASTGIEFHRIGHALAQAPGNYWDFTNQLVAGFGYLEFRLPRIVYVAWFSFIATLLVVSLSTGSRRDREVVLTGGALMVVVPILLWLLVGRAIGNGLSGRLFLPVLVAFPMLCGEVVYRNRKHLGQLASRALSWSGSLVGVVQFTAWYLNARRAAVGTHGPLLFTWHSRWAPPLGWPLWLGCAALGAALLCSFCWPARPQRAESRPAALARWRPSWIG